MPGTTPKCLVQDWRSHATNVTKTVETVTAKKLGTTKPDELQPSLLLQVQNSIKMLYVPVRIRQKRSSPSIPGSPR